MNPDKELPPTVTEEEIALPQLDLTPEDVATEFEWDASVQGGVDGAVPVAWLACRERQLLEALNALREARQQIADLQAQLSVKGGGWISVEDRLPELSLSWGDAGDLIGNYAEVMIFVEGRCACGSLSAFIGQDPSWANEDGSSCAPTHWRPRPLPPEQKEGKK